MAAILVDDTRNPAAGTYGPGLAREVSEIVKYQSSRHDTYAWARNLRFLVYDDEDDDEDERVQNQDTPARIEAEGEDSDDEEEKQLQQAIAMSLATEEDEGTSSDTAFEDKQSNHDRSELEFESEQEMLDYALAMSLQEDEAPKEDEVSSTNKGMNTKTASNLGNFARSCDTCKQYPQFPAFKKPTKFRVLKFRPEDLVHAQICSHYAAVSYCWRSDNTGTAAAADKSYRIRVQNPDGTCTERSNRAPNEIIDRAVDAARALGCRLIWIDQECLPQDKSREMELGIQAMDMVYQRALFTIGLFESIIPRQAHIDAIAAVLHWGMRKKKDPDAGLVQRRPGVSLSQLCLDLLEFLELLADDWWNTRAWILQEAFSSSDKLAILIRIAAGIYFNSPSGNDNHKIGDPDMVKGSCTFRVRDILELVRVSKQFLMSGVVEREDYSQVDLNTLVEYRNDGHTAEWYERAVEVLARLDRMFPIPAATMNRHASMYATGGANFGPRKTCNAAVALYFLRTRLNHRPADRLAILANLCDYEIRLDTTEIENRFTSLSICLVTLALVNGDLSLLNPDVYSNFRVKAPLEGPSWALPFSEILHSINNMSTLRAGYNLTLRNSNRYSLSESGLGLPAALFDVNRKVDFTPVKLQWESEWRKFTCLEIEVEWRDEESMEEHELRRAEIVRQIHEDHESTDPARRSFEGIYDWDFEPDPALGATIIRTVSKDHADGIPLLRALLGRILMEILIYLHCAGESSLANSIWHSIRLDCASTDYNSRFNSNESNLDFLPDTVEELIQNQELISHIWPALQLDPHQNGFLCQMWFIHRIMKYGFLWVGNYISSSPPISAPPPVAEPQQTPKLRPNILELQSVEQLVACEFKKNLHELPDDGLPLGALVSFAMSTIEPMWERDARLRSQVAAFNVDGPCTVAVPYDGDMERLPRPVIRSMAAAWIVKPVLGSEKGSEAGPGHEIKAREGLGEDYDDTTPPLSSSSSDPNEKGEADLALKEVPHTEDANHIRVDKGKGKMNESTSDLDDRPEAAKDYETFRIVDRVMGVWEILRTPINLYTFV